jgi:hypothetical protein
MLRSAVPCTTPVSGVPIGSVRGRRPNSGVPPGRVSVRRCAVSRNRPLASLAPGGQRSFLDRGLWCWLCGCWPVRVAPDGADFVGAVLLGPRENILPARAGRWVRAPALNGALLPFPPGGTRHPDEPIVCGRTAL